MELEGSTAEAQGAADKWQQEARIAAEVCVGLCERKRDGNGISLCVPSFATTYVLFLVGGAQLQIVVLGGRLCWALEGKKERQQPSRPRARAHTHTHTHTQELDDLRTANASLAEQLASAQAALERLQQSGGNVCNASSTVRQPRQRMFA